MGACSTTTEALRKMGCKTSGGRLFCNDRAGGETLNHGFKARFGFEQQDRDQTLCLVPVLLFNAEDGT